MVHTCHPSFRRLRQENCLNPRDRDCCELRSHHCTPVWMIGWDCISKKKKKEEMTFHVQVDLGMEKEVNVVWTEGKKTSEWRHSFRGGYDKASWRPQPYIVAVLILQGLIHNRSPICICCPQTPWHILLTWLRIATLLISFLHIWLFCLPCKLILHNLGMAVTLKFLYLALTFCPLDANI